MILRQRQKEVRTEDANTFSKIIEANPILSRQEEIELAKIIRHSKNKKQVQNAREKLINSNIKLVLQIASSYSPKYKISSEDMVSAGIEGLTIAVDRYNPEKFNTKFSTYATSWIKLKIFKFIKTFASVLHIPSNVEQKKGLYGKMVREARENEENLTDEELMEQLDVTEVGLRRLKLTNYAILHLDQKISEEGSTILQEVIPDTRSIGADKLFAIAERKDIIRQLLTHLKPIQRDIIKARYLYKFDGERLIDIGKKYNMSGERVRQIEYGALKILRKRMKNKSHFSI